MERDSSLPTAGVDFLVQEIPRKRSREFLSSIPKQALEAGRRQLRITHRILDRLMAKIGLCVATRTTAVGSSLVATSIAARPDRDKIFEIGLVELRAGYLLVSRRS